MSGKYYKKMSNNVKSSTSSIQEAKKRKHPACTAHVSHFFKQAKASTKTSKLSKTSPASPALEIESVKEEDEEQIGGFGEESLADTFTVAAASFAVAVANVLDTLPDYASRDDVACDSDSSLLSAPTSLGSPSSSAPPTPKVIARKLPLRSPYFRHKPRPKFLPCLPFPPLSEPNFGLMQERLADDPYRLLLATIFLNQTPGERAMPVFFQLMEAYPAVADLAAAVQADVTAIIQCLGFQNQRAAKCIALSKVWLDKPPEKGKRYRKLHYPCKGNGKDVDVDETIDDQDERVAWEISHLAGIGPYAHDSWRMFCRDQLRGLANGWNGEGAAADDFEPEWKRVLPLDKELRAWMYWMWLKEGWEWNKETGKRTKADPDLMRRARGGGVVQEVETKETLYIIAKNKDELEHIAVGKPAGDFMDLG